MPPNETPTPVFADLPSLLARLEVMGATISTEDPGLTELDHGLQCAFELSQAAPADVELQVAGLAHDIAHGLGHIRDHGEVGGAAVRGLLGERVAELVMLHIPAKRYLVTTDPAYRARLSLDSVQTLALQGGDMTDAEVTAFEGFSHWRDALLLRVADEAAKVPGRSVPGLGHWRQALAATARA
jgi:predicted HD phosphohydrolase